MLLFKKAFHEGLKSGAITVTYRRWAKPKVKVGGRYRCHPIGVLEVDAVSRVLAREISEAAARGAGYPDRASLLRTLEAYGGSLGAEEQLFCVVLHHGGDGDRVGKALDAELAPDEVKALREKLRGMDARASEGPWTATTLKLIQKHPRVAASQLATKCKRETAPFKADVVKLKKLGLTQSFEVGYELSPRGRAFVEKTRWRW